MQQHVSKVQKTLNLLYKKITPSFEGAIKILGNL